uniref:TonB family protein n=1 Tax=uncultured bacterium LAB25 TaxID=1204707 RepID=M4PWG7_9BACT|nr:TonB family protein [uncultured bacterium LAB25]
MNPTTRYLLGLIFVLALCLVALEWNTDGTGWAFFDTAANDLEAEMELSPLHREDDEVPMMVPQEPQEKMPPSQELNLVEEDVEIAPEVLEPVTLTEEPKVEEQEELPEAVDMYNEPLDYRVVEDLPQFPGGAVEFMKWLTKNLKYPATAQQRKVQGRVVAQFIVNTDGSVSDIQVVERLSAECDREALRVLRMMPKWQPGLMNAKPCRTKVCIPIVFKL